VKGDEMCTFGYAVDSRNSLQQQEMFEVLKYAAMRTGTKGVNTPLWHKRWLLSSVYCPTLAISSSHIAVSSWFSFVYKCHIRNSTQ